jgi:NDP-sugar pyrophosphorylase family protein
MKERRMAGTLEGMLLGAGLGTRMGPLSRVLPKPAWPLGGRSILQWGADSFGKFGIQRLACNAHLHPEALRAVACGLEVFEEPELLGSAGGLRSLQSRIGLLLLTWNADVVGDPPWDVLKARHLESGADLSWLLVPHPGGPWTQVWLDSLGRILPRGETGEGPYHFTGAAAWSPAALDLLPPGSSEVRDLLPRLRQHAAVVVPPFPWREIGTPDQLIAAALALAPTGEGRLAGCYIHPDAQPAGTLQRCVLGPGARPHPAVKDESGFWFEERGRQVRLGL